MKTIFRTLILVSALLVAGISNAQEPAKLYGIKSGHLKFETQTSGGTQYNEVWFDDYGRLRKQHDQIQMEGLGNYHTEILYRDGKMYSNAWFDNEKKDEAKMSEGPAADAPNFLEMTEEFMKKNKIEILGTEDIMGRTCTIYTYKQKSLLRTVTRKDWIWQGIVLRMETKGALGANNTMVLKEFTENPQLPASTFDLPANIK